MRISKLICDECKREIENPLLGFELVVPEEIGELEGCIDRVTYDFCSKECLVKWINKKLH